MIKLDWHIVCGSLEIEELLKAGLLDHWLIKDPRHQLFYTMKHPNTTAYKGHWGPELLIQEDDEDILLGRPARVWSTIQRKQEIVTWIITNIYAS